MARSVRGRGWLGIGVTVAVLAVVVVVVIWQSLEQSTNPDYQVRQSAGGVGEYYVNLWLDPHPPETGPVEISAQLTSIIGTPIEVAYLIFEIGPVADDAVIEITPDLQVSRAGREDVHVALAQFDQAGLWNVVVRYSFGGTETRVTFEIDVAE